jgi:hypothetical protein
VKTSAVAIMLVPVLLAMSVTPADVSGIWSLRLMTSDGESAPRASVTLKQNGATLTGSCVIDNVDQELTVGGQVTDNTLTWRCAGKGPFEASFKGTIDSTGRQMTGEWTHAGAGAGNIQGFEKPAVR